MQKRSSHPGESIYRGEVSLVTVDDDFPVMAYDFTQEDKTINELHRHEVMEIGLCHEGSGIFVIEDKCFDFQAGDIVVINSSEYHLAQSHRGTNSAWTFLHFKTDAFNEPIALDEIMSLSGPSFCNRILAKENSAIRHCVEVIIKDLADKPKHWQACVRASIQQLLALICRLDNKNTAQTHSLKDLSCVVPAIALMSTHYHECISNADLADACHLSEAHFRRQFKSLTGQTPHHYLNQMRIQIALGLLQNSDKSILSISIECGFSTLSTFNRQFKEQMACSPRDYRKVNVR